MKKPFMKKEDLDDEYIKVSANETCHIPLTEATKLLNLKPGDLPTIKMFAKDLTKTIEFIENERATDLLEYQNHIFLIRERLIPQDYLKVKDKLKSQYKEENLLDSAKRYLIQEKADWNTAFKSAAQSRPAMRYKDAVSFIDTAGLNSTEKRSALKAAKKWLR